MLIFLIALLLGLIVVLAIPIELAFTLQREERLQTRVTLGWLFGLVKIPLSVEGEKADSAAPPAPKKPRHTQSRRKLHMGAMLLSQGFVARVIRLLRRLKASIHIRQLRLQILLGLDDPADTGQLWGIVGPLALTIPVPAGADVAIQPEFTGATFQVDGEGVIRIVPIEIIGTILVFTFSPVTIRALYALGTGR